MDNMKPVCPTCNQEGIVGDEFFNICERGCERIVDGDPVPVIRYICGTNGCKKRGDFVGDEFLIKNKIERGGML